MDACSRLGCELVIGVDVGGDSLALGFEENLWSPLADSIGVSALANTVSQGLKALLAVAYPGADGELPFGYVLKRISEVAEKGGLVGGYILSIEDIEILKKLIGYAYTESSSTPLSVYSGLYGVKSIRFGLRRVFLSPIQITVFMLKPDIVASLSLAKHLLNCESFVEANEILHRLGVYTEFDLELDVSRAIAEKGSITKDDVWRLREHGRYKLRKGRGNTTENF